MTLDPFNRGKHHAVVVGSLALAASLWAAGYGVSRIIAAVLLFTSNIWAYRFVGPKAWKRHQSHGTYVMFWLFTVHIYDQTFLRDGAPDG
jgi:sulfoxide reductase heme-binding subunit YedZ